MPAAVDTDALRRELEGSLEGEVRFDALSRALYATDASVYQILPAGVVIPKTREDLLRVVRSCRRHRCSITMRGGGTSQAGQAIGAGLVLDTSKYFNRLIEVNAEARWARVEPGIVLDELNASLASQRLRFAPDISTASRATVGGMISNNSAGARSVLYGKTIDHVLELQVLLADGTFAWFRPVPAQELEPLSRGTTLEASCYREVRRLAHECAGEIERRYPKILRRVGGYNLDEFVDEDRPFNLAKLIVGSEGTLGIILEAKVNLVPLPAAKAVLVVQFDDLLESLAATPAILAHKPSAVEVMDAFILDHTRQSPDLHRLRQTFVEGEPASLLCVEFYGDRAEDLPPRIDALERDLAARHHRVRCHRAIEPAAQQAIWQVREAALGLAMATKDDAKAVSFVEDTAVAPEKLRDYIRDFLALVSRHGTEAGVYAHASVGCLHVRPVVNMKTESGVRQFETISSDVADLVLAYGGALSGEHGDGLVRSPFMERMFGPVLYRAFRDIKRTFDPDGLFNPGKIVDAPPLAANLRYGTAYRSPPVTTQFDYQEYGGLAGAVEMCSGLGACRKTQAGTMCPSFMATRDEAHSTRGRANALRLALSGTLGEAGLSDEAVHDVLDLCLECRACRTECPVGVDVARMKSEFLAAYWRRRGTPARARLLGHIDGVARWGSRLAPVSNVLAGNTVARRLNEGLFGIDRRRTPPAWVRQTFRRQGGSRRPAVSPADLSGVASAKAEAGRDVPQNGTVALFVDTFTNHQHPSVGMAGLDVIERLGYGVTLAPNVCCGRPLISQGLLDHARDRARENARRLLPLVEGDRSLVFFEPSCLSAVREDAPDLLSGDDRRKARTVAARSSLFEEWLESECRSGRARLSLRSGPATVLVHGHCHQKALGALPAAKALLTRIPGVTIVDPDAGCCGMAGSFGYAREHFDVSRAIGERRLLPAARALGPDGVLVASGTSCRQQIADFTGVRAVHAAELIHSLLGPTRMNLAVLSVSALVLAVVVSCVSRLNVGVLAIALAWIVGVYVGGLSASAVMGGFPSQLFLTLAGVTLLFAMAQSNGTLPRLTYHAVRVCRGNMGTIPIMFFVLGAALSSMGPGNIATAALLAPIAMATAARAGIPLFLMAIMVGNGSNAGGLSPFAPTGIIVNGILTRNQMPGLEAQSFLYNLGMHALVAFGGYLLFGGLRLFAADRTVAATIDPEAEKPFNRRQWITLAVIGALIMSVLVAGVHVGMAAFCGAVVLVLLGAADDGEAIKLMPWRVIIMVCGVTVLIALVEKFQGLDLLVAMVARISTPETVPGVVALITGIVSVYSSTSGVVLPAFLPLVPGLAAELPGSNAVGIAMSMNIGGHIVDVSPLSTIGALCMAGAAASDSRKLFIQLLAWGLSMAVVAAILCYLVF